MQVLLMTGEEKDSSSFYDSGNQAVTGVLIVAEGADNSVVSRNIVEGVMALFQLDAHKIKVMITWFFFRIFFTLPLLISFSLLHWRF